MLWSSPGNWSFFAAPVPADNVLFDNVNVAVASGVVDNIVDANFTIANLAYRTPSTLGFHTTQINPGLSLNIAANSVTPSIFVGTGASFTGAINIYDRFVGGGTLTVTNNLGAINASQGGDNNDHFATLDLSGLTNFSASVSQILVGCIGDNTASGVRPMASCAWPTSVIYRRPRV